MMRTVRYVAALVLFSVWHASKVVLAGLVRIPHRPGDVYDRAGGEWARAVLKWCRIGVVVEGRERLDPKAPCVYIANHASFLDILAILQEFPGSLRFVYKKGMSWIPVLGWAMLFARHIPIDRRNRSAAFAAYDDAAQFIRQGASALHHHADAAPLEHGPGPLAAGAVVHVARPVRNPDEAGEDHLGRVPEDRKSVV